MSVVKVLKDSDNWIGKFVFASRLLSRSFALWNFSDWIRFWTTRNFNTVRLGTFTFRLRNETFPLKIADLAMIFETVVFDCYGVCPIRPGDVVIDIGAHIGGYMCKASQIVGNGKVLAFEPSPHTFDALTQNAALNRASNVDIQNLAVSSKTGETRILHLNESNPADNSFFKKGQAEVPVKTITLKDIFDRHDISRCNVLKMDCEGAEYEILLTGDNVLDKIDRIILEYHDPKLFNLDERFSPATLADYLRKNSFRVEMKKDNNYQGTLYAERIAA